MSEDNPLLQQKKEKMLALRDAGANPFANGYAPTASAAESAILTRTDCVLAASARVDRTVTGCIGGAVRRRICRGIRRRVRGCICRRIHRSVLWRVGRCVNDSAGRLAFAGQLVAHQPRFTVVGDLAIPAFRLFAAGKHQCCCHGHKGDKRLHAK